MRPIKFQCYIQSLKRIFPVLSIVDPRYEEGIRVFPDKPIVEGEKTNYLTSEGDIKLMQFTGLLDKNGKEIYEGDIVDWVEPSTNFDFPRRSVVEFAEKSAGFHPFIGWHIIDNGNVDDNTFSNSQLEYEIIGNIYENSDLISK